MPISYYYTFLSKYDKDNKLIWKKRIAVSSPGRWLTINDFDIDPNGNIFIGGTYDNDYYFKIDDVILPSRDKVGDFEQQFILKLDSTGVCKWSIYSNNSSGSNGISSIRYINDKTIYVSHPSADLHFPDGKNISVGHGVFIINTNGEFIKSFSLKAHNYYAYDHKTIQLVYGSDEPYVIKYSKILFDEDKIFVVEKYFQELDYGDSTLTTNYWSAAMIELKRNDGWGNVKKLNNYSAAGYGIIDYNIVFNNNSNYYSANSLINRTDLIMQDHWTYSNIGVFCKYDQYNNIIWSNNITEGRIIKLISSNNNEKIYVLGDYSSKAIRFISQHIDTFGLKSIYDNQSFLACYDSSGDLQWAKNIGINNNIALSMDEKCGKLEIYTLSLETGIGYLTKTIIDINGSCLPPVCKKLKLINPGDSMYYCANYEFNISWDFENISSINIKIKIDNENVKTLADNYPATKSHYKWFLPDSLKGKHNIEFYIFDSSDNLFSDSALIFTGHPGYISIGKDTTIELTSQITVNAPPGFKTYLWNDNLFNNGSFNFKALDYKLGNYKIFIKATDSMNCYLFDTIDITVINSWKPKPGWNKEITEPLDFKLINFINKDTGYCFATASMNSRYLTYDSGINWIIDTGYHYTFKTGMFSDDNLLGFGTTNQNIIITENGGISWSTVSNSGSFYYPFFINKLIGWSYTNNNIIQTTDGGLSWKGKALIMGAKDIFFLNSDSGFVLSSNVVYKTVNDFQTSSILSIPGSLGSEIRFYNDSIGWIIGKAGLVYRTIDACKTWTDQSILNGGDLIDIKIIGERTLCVAGSNGSIYVTYDAGSSWVKVNTTTSKTFNSITKYGDNMWIAGDGGEIYYFYTGNNNAPTLSYPVRNQRVIYNENFNIPFDVNLFNDQDSADQLTYWFSYGFNAKMPDSITFDKNELKGKCKNHSSYIFRFNATDNFYKTTYDDFYFIVDKYKKLYTAYILCDSTTDYVRFLFPIKTFSDLDLKTDIKYDSCVAGGILLNPVYTVVGDMLEVKINKSEFNKLQNKNVVIFVTDKNMIGARIELIQGSAPIDIDDLSSDEITIFPNPCHNDVIINNMGDGISILRIYNNIGQEIKMININSNITDINTSELVPGIYIFEIWNNNKKYNFQIRKE